MVTGGAITLAGATTSAGAGADGMVVGMPVMAREAYARRDFVAMAKVAERLVALVTEARTPEARAAFVERWLTRYANLGDTATGDSAAPSAPRRSNT